MKTWMKGACAMVAVLAVTSACASGSSSSDDSGESTVASDVPTLEALYKGPGTVPPTEGPAPAKGKSVWWISCSDASSGCAAPAKYAAEAGKKLGFDFHEVDGKFNAGGAWAAAIRTALAADADAIILHGISCPAVQQPLEEAKKQGVLVMGSDGNDCSDTGGPSLFSAPMVYSDTMSDSLKMWTEFGKTSAAYIIRKSEGKAKVIMNSGTEPQQKFVDDGFREEFKKCSGCEIVGTVKYSSPDLAPNGAWIQSFRTALLKYPTANAVYFPFDLMASSLGGLSAVKEAGLEVTSFGGQSQPDTLDLVRDGKYDALSSARPGGWLAYASMDNINRYLNGEKAVSQGLSFIVIDKDHNLPKEAGEPMAGTTDWESAYDKLWSSAK